MGDAAGRSRAAAPYLVVQLVRNCPNSQIPLQHPSHTFDIFLSLMLVRKELNLKWQNEYFLAFTPNTYEK
jgi:hypothetical protein